MQVVIRLFTSRPRDLGHVARAVARLAREGVTAIVAGRAASETEEPADNEVIVVDPGFPGAREYLARLLPGSQRPGVLVIADFAKIPAADVVAFLRRYPRVRVVTYGMDDSPREIGEALVSLLGPDRVAEAVQPLLGQLSSDVLRFTSWVLEREDVVGTDLRQAGKALGVSKRTIQRWFADYPGLTAGQVIDWVAVLRATSLVSHLAVPPSTAADRMGFSSASDLYRRYTRLVGVRLSRVERHSAFDVAVGALRRRLISA